MSLVGARGVPALQLALLRVDYEPALFLSVDVARRERLAECRYHAATRRFRIEQGEVVSAKPDCRAGMSVMDIAGCSVMQCRSFRPTKLAKGDMTGMNCTY